MKTKKGGILVKIVVAILAVYAVTTLMSLQGQLKEVQEQKEKLEAQVEQQTSVNDQLAEDIENSGSDDTVRDIARDKLGLVNDGEKVFYDVSN